MRKSNDRSSHEKTVLALLKEFGRCTKEYACCWRSFKILTAANRPFKRTRRRLPPQAEQELSAWLDDNRSIGYPTDDYIEDFVLYEGIEEDQVRIFWPNSGVKWLKAEFENAPKVLTFLYLLKNRWNQKCYWISINY